MPIDNPIFLRLKKGLQPIITVGVGSAICTVCSKLKLNVNKLEKKDLPLLKAGLLEYYINYWTGSIEDIRKVLERTN